MLAGASRGSRRRSPSRSRSTPTRPRSPRGRSTRGATIVNDVSALLYDPALGRVAAETGAALVLMHNRGRSRRDVRPRGLCGRRARGGGRAARRDRERPSREAGHGGARSSWIPVSALRSGRSTAFEVLRGLPALAALGRPISERPIAQVVSQGRAGRAPAARRASGAPPPPSPRSCSSARTSSASTTSGRWSRSCGSRTHQERRHLTARLHRYWHLAFAKLPAAMPEFSTAWSATGRRSAGGISSTSLIVSILIYEVLKLIRGTRAVQMAIGSLLVVGLFYVVAASRRCRPLNWLIRNVLVYVAFAAIVSSSPTSGARCRTLGRRRSSGTSRGSRRSDETIEEVIVAATMLAGARGRGPSS